MNTILVPTFTLPLDTEVGGERTAVQLVDVDKNGTKYKFNIDKVKRFINIYSTDYNFIEELRKKLNLNINRE